LLNAKRKAKIYAAEAATFLKKPGSYGSSWAEVVVAVVDPPVSPTATSMQIAMPPFENIHHWHRNPQL
jgi:hypothetical protein